MDYFISAVFVLLAIVNLNLVRLAFQTGKIQSRAFHITRTGKPLAFMIAVMLQIFISCIAVLAAIIRISG